MGAERRSDRWALAVHVASLVAALGLLLDAGAEQWFFGDEWDFLVDRRATSLDDLLRPHNEHWSTLPLLLWRGLFRLVGLHAYWPYLLPVVLGHLVLTHLVWRLVVRAQGDAWVATGLCAAYALFGAGHENLLWGFQLGFVGSLLLAYTQVLLHDHDGPPDRRDVAGAVVGVVALLTSGIAVVGVAIAGGVAAARGRWRSALLATVPPALVYAGWLLTYGSGGLATHGAEATRTPLTVARFVLAGLTATVGSFTGIQPYWGIVALGVALALGALWRGWRARPDALSPVVLAAGAAVMFAIIGAGRGGGGGPVAGSSRYLHLGAGLLLPAAGSALTLVTRRSWWGRVPVLVACSVMALHGWHVLGAAAVDSARLEQDLRRRYLAAAELLEDGVTEVDANVDAFRSPNLQVAELRELADQDRLPDPPELTASDRLEAAAALQLTLAPRTALEPGAPPAPAVAGTAGLTDLPADPGCRAWSAAADAQLALAFAGPSALLVTSEVDGTVLAYLGDDEAVADDPERLRLVADQQLELALTRPDSSLVLTLPRLPRLEVCGLAEPSG